MIRHGFIVAAGLSFGGCFYGYDITTNATAISGTSYPASTIMPEIYFEDNIFLIDKVYEQLAFIEVTGAKYSPTQELLEEMKKKAASLGADAVIGIQQHYIVRDRGEVFLVLIGEDEPEAYDTRNLTGIAIKYH